MKDFLKNIQESLDDGEANEGTSEFKKKMDAISEKADNLKDKTIEELEEMVDDRSADVAPVSAEEIKEMDKNYNSTMSSIRSEEEMLASFARIENEKSELVNLQEEVEQCEIRITRMTEKHEEKYGKV